MSDAPVKKSKKPAAPAQHPKYNEMIKAAVGALKERTGSSRQAITKYIKANYKVADGCDPHIKLALKRMVNKAELVQTKGTGASGSFKLNKAAKEPAAKKKPAAKKPAAKKVAKKPAKKSTPKKEAKKTAKKAAAKKASPKKATQPKKTAAKKPAAKKPAKKPTAKKAGKKPAAKKAVKKSAKK